jgi:hypothetical protein
MKLNEVLSGYSLSDDEIEAGLRMLEFVQQDIASLGQSGNRFVDLLRQYPVYSPNPDQSAALAVHYADPTDLNLMHLREQYDLDAIAGQGAEIDQLCNLMHWVHGLAIHTSNAVVPEKLNSLDLLHLIRTAGKHINCWMFATILNDVYLALGWKSRIVHLKPYKKDHIESHVVNSVYCQQLAKWLFFDPNLSAYFVDEWGEILSVTEIRQRFVDGVALEVNDELAFNSDNRVFAALGQHFGKEFYRLYIAKNIFRYDCRQFSTFDYESSLDGRVYIELLPLGYHAELLAQPQLTANYDQIIYTTDRSRFWQVSLQ